MPAGLHRQHKAAKKNAMTEEARLTGSDYGPKKLTEKSLIIQNGNGKDLIICLLTNLTKLQLPIPKKIHFVKRNSERKSAGPGMFMVCSVRVGKSPPGGTITGEAMK